MRESVAVARIFRVVLVVFATLAFDYFVGFGGGRHLLGLRAVYLIEVLLWLAYVTILAIVDGGERR